MALGNRFFKDHAGRLRGLCARFSGKAVLRMPTPSDYGEKFRKLRKPELWFPLGLVLVSRVP